MTEDTLDAAQTDGPAPTDGEGAAPADDEGAAPTDGPAPIDPTAPTDGEGAAPTDGEGAAPTTAPTDGAWHLRGILESLVFASDRPVKPARLARLARAALAEVKTELERLAQDYRERGVQLVEVGGGWQFRTHPANASFVREITASKPVRLSRAQMETLAIIAYRQPITRPEFEDIRGVDSGSALKFLLEREVVKVLGRKEDVGRPLLYGTTPQFLEMFGLSSLRELPTLRELSELTDESKKLFEKRAGEPFVVESGPVAGTYESADDDEMDTIERPLDAPPAAEPEVIEAFVRDHEDMIAPDDETQGEAASPPVDGDEGDDEDDDDDVLPPVGDDEEDDEEDEDEEDEEDEDRSS